jgi:hypothetical protein
MASVSALAASSFLIAGQLSLTPLTIAIGLAWGMMIFFFDRALVSGSFNPYHFTEDEVRSLADGRVATPWAHIATQRRSHGRAREFLRVLAVGSLRIALALATSFIVADMVLFLVFQPEVNARAAFLQQELQAQRVASIQADFATENDRRAAQRRELTGASDPEVVRLTDQVATLTAQLDPARKDLGVLQAAAAAEIDGDKYQGTLSDGTVVKTTGNRGDGAAARSLAQRRDTQQATVNDLQTRLNRARTALDDRLADLKDVNASAWRRWRPRQVGADQAAAWQAPSRRDRGEFALLRKNAVEPRVRHEARDPVRTIPPCTGLLRVAVRGASRDRPAHRWARRARVPVDLLHRDHADHVQDDQPLADAAPTRSLGGPGGGRPHRGVPDRRPPPRRLEGGLRPAYARKAWRESGLASRAAAHHGTAGPADRQREDRYDAQTGGNGHRAIRGTYPAHRPVRRPVPPGRSRFPAETWRRVRFAANRDLACPGSVVVGNCAQTDRVGKAHVGRRAPATRTSRPPPSGRPTAAVNGARSPGGRVCSPRPA